MAAVELMNRTHALFLAGGTIYAARHTGLYQVAENGEAQNLFQRGLPDEDLPALAIAVDSAADLLFAGINGGVARSADGGQSWALIPFRAPPPLTICLAYCPDYAGAGVILAGTYEDGIFRSTDGGQSWRATNHGLFDHSVNCLTLSPDVADDVIVYAGTCSGIYRSDNGGKLWQDMRMPAGDETVLSLALSHNGADIYAGTEGHGLLRSADGGESWERLLETEGDVNAIALAEDGSLVAQVDDAVLSASTGSGNWTEIIAGSVDCLLLDAEGGQLVLALSDGSLRREAL